MSPHQSTAAASAGAALRARLTVVPPRALAHSQAARTPFAVLVIALLAAGVVGLLMFNTHMQQTSFAATEMQQRANALTAQQQRLDLELDLLRDPQQVATKAQELGMVAPAQPAFLRLSDGEVLGEPAPASPNDAIAIGPAPAKKPEVLERRTIIVPAAPAAPAAPAEPAERAGNPAGRTASGEAPVEDGN